MDILQFDNSFEFKEIYFELIKSFDIYVINS